MGRKTPLKGVRGWDRFLVRLRRRVAPAHVLVFGSRARGDHLNESDVDILVVANSFDGMKWIARVQLVQSLWDGDLMLEPLCYTEAEFAKRSKEISIVREAARTGIPVTI